MDGTLLPLPEEPRALRALARTLVEQAPLVGVDRVVAGGWLADPLWEKWGPLLRARGLDRERFDQIVADYGNELRLWVIGERPWAQVITGLAGRAVRRLPVPSDGPDGGEERRRDGWQTALARVGLRADADQAGLEMAIGQLGLLHDLTAEESDGGPVHHATVWSGIRPRDPEGCWGDGRSASSTTGALAQALGRFLLRDPAFPPPSHHPAP